MSKFQKISDTVWLCIFSFIILFIGTGIFLLPQKNFSDSENRTLAQLPKPSVSEVIGGEYFNGVKDFYSDQLPFRKEFGYIYALSELALGKKEVNGVVVCDNVTVKRNTASDFETLEKNLASVKKLQARNDKAVFFTPPSSEEVFENKLPKLCGKSLPSELRVPSGKSAEDFLEEIKSSGEPEKYYFRTDHHWTAYGAYRAYVLLAHSLGITPCEEDFFQTEIASRDFYGTSFSRTALPKGLIDADVIELYRYVGDTDFTITASGYGPRQGFYDTQALETQDKYRVYLGGNYSRISIKSTAEQNTPRQKMLIIKDSFANSLIPFLTLHFDLEVIDPRYTDTAEADKLSGERFDEILILCSADTLATERSFARIIDTVF